MFQDLSDGELFIKSVFDLCKHNMDGFPPAIGLIREEYWRLVRTKESIGVKLPDLTNRWTTPPPEWLELKKKLGLTL